MGLYKTFDIPDEIEDVEPIVTYGTSWLFDFDAGDFVTVAGKVSEADEYRAWVQWCVKAALTERGVFAVYDDQHGVDLEQELQASLGPDDSEGIIEASITEALLVDPRTASVYGFGFVHEGDEIGVSFTVEPTIGTTAHVELNLTA